MKYKPITEICRTQKRSKYQKSVHAEGYASQNSKKNDFLDDGFILVVKYFDTTAIKLICKLSVEPTGFPSEFGNLWTVFYIHDIASQC